MYKRYGKPIYSLWKLGKVKEAVSAAQRIIAATNRDLLDLIARDSSLLRHLDWRRFEEIIAELLELRGWQVDLTAPSHDNGYDILAVRNLGEPEKLLVECKHYRQDRKVGIALVKQLWSTYMLERASRAMLATSSFFTRGARRFESEHEYQIALRDHDYLVDWIQGHEYF